MTLSIALDLPVDTVRMAINEISDKGVIFSVGDASKDAYSILPLTRDFLLNKWHESDLLRRKVADRFAELFSSDRTEGILLDWPEDRRVQLLKEHAQDKFDSGDYGAALKLVRLAQTWLEHSGLSALEVQLRFLEGKVLYRLGNRPAGIAHMRHAIGRDIDGDIVEGDELLFFADAVFSHGERAAEREASDLLLLALSKGGVLSESRLIRFLDSNLPLRNHKMIAGVISRIEGGQLLLVAFDRIGRLLDDNTFAYSYEKELRPALDRLCTSSSIDEDRQRYYSERYGKMRQRVSRR